MTRPFARFHTLMIAGFLACVPPQDRGGEDNGGAGGAGGKTAGGGGSEQGSGGSAGSGSASGGNGGSGTGGAAAGNGGSGGTPAGGAAGSSAGGAGGASSGSGGETAGAGGAAGAAGGSGGSNAGGSSGGGADAGPSANPPTGAGSWEYVSNTIVNCVFCHPGEGTVKMNSDFYETGLYQVLLSEMDTPYVPAACAFKRLVVPGKPDESLLYLKLLPTVPPNCGARMPKPPSKYLEQADIDAVRKWIELGAGK